MGFTRSLGAKLNEVWIVPTLLRGNAYALNASTTAVQGYRISPGEKISVPIPEVDSTPTQEHGSLI